MFIICNDRDVKQLQLVLTKIVRKLDTLQETHDMAYADLKAGLEAVTTFVQNIDADVTALNAKITALETMISTSAMTSAEMAEAQELIDGLKAQTQALADRTTDAPPVDPPADE